MRRRARKRQEKREDRRLIFNTLRATLLRSFKRLHSEKRVCVRGVPGKLGPSGWPTAILTQSKRGWGPHHHVEVAVDWCSSILLALHVYIT